MKKFTSFIAFLFVAAVALYIILNVLMPVINALLQFADQLSNL